jgi:hypothetical protein
MDDLFQVKRRIKSLTERILFLGGSLTENETINCYILGSSNNMYTINLHEWFGQIKYSCNCPDYTIRNLPCKHIYWLGAKKFGNMDPIYWRSEAYDRLFREFSILNNNNYVGRNLDCPICLEDIDYQHEPTICCIYQCNNSVHAICWTRYSEISGKTNCVMCRSEMM